MEWGVICAATTATVRVVESGGKVQGLFWLRLWFWFWFWLRLWN
jgi:hypothetical protein